MASKQEIQEELDLILTVIEKLGSATPAQIQENLKNKLSTRKLQRRLKELIESGLIERTGNTHGVAYQITEKNTAGRSTQILNPHEKDEGLIPLSAKGLDIKKNVSRPTQSRHPVSYHREFLDNYIPNKSSYLTAVEKKRLANIGNTGLAEAAGGTYAKQILQRLLVDLAWNSSRLEGNTYSLLETKLLLDKGVKAEDKSGYEAQMIFNHKQAIEFLVQDSQHIGFNRYTILSLHALLSDNLLPDAAASGRLRKQVVGIEKSVYKPLEIPQQIEEIFEEILKKAAQIKNPFEQAFFVMVHLPYLQAFDDVNKRVSRLAANIPFIQNNLSPLSFTEVPKDLYVAGLLGVYELNQIELLKDVFLWAYERSAQQYAAQRQSLGEPDLFRMKYRTEIREIVKKIILQPAGKKKADMLIEAKALQIPAEDKKQFIATVSSELYSLHEGNFARYYVSPGEFQKWRKVWDGRNGNSYPAY